MKVTTVAWALVAMALALCASELVEAVVCDGKSASYVDVECKRKPEDKLQSCHNFAQKVFVTLGGVRWMARNQRACNQNPNKSRCCYSSGGTRTLAGLGQAKAALQAIVSTQDTVEEDEVSITCINPQLQDSGNWTDLEIIVVGDFPGLNLAPGNYSTPFVPTVEVNPPSACRFVMANIQRNLAAGVWETAEGQQNLPAPNYGVIDLEQPASGKCSRYPNEDICDCDEGADCPGYCLKLVQDRYCEGCSQYECASLCNGDFTCAGIEYNIKTNQCWLLFRPPFETTLDLTGEGGDGEPFLDFLFGQPFPAPPPVGESNDDLVCFGKSEVAIIPAKAVEVTNDGVRGRCAVENSANRVQRCGHDHYNQVGLCGPAQCNAMCSQDPECQAYDYEVAESKCFLVHNEMPSAVVDGTSDVSRCFSVEREGVAVADSDSYKIFRDFGFRDVFVGDDELDLFDPEIITQTETEAPTDSPTQSPSTPPSRRRRRRRCSLTKGKRKCCQKLGRKKFRCCEGKKDVDRGCCTGAKDKATCCASDPLTGNPYCFEFEDFKPTVKADNSSAPETITKSPYSFESLLESLTDFEASDETFFYEGDYYVEYDEDDDDGGDA